MTHERHKGLGSEPPDGPQNDQRLPNAESVPEYSDVERSLAPPMIDVTGIGQLPGTEMLGAEPGWWLETGDVADNPAHPPPGYGADQSEPEPGALQSFWLDDRY